MNRHLIPHSLRRLIAVLVLAASAMSGAAAQTAQADTVYTFCFVSDKDMFLVPFRDNADQLRRLFECVEQYERQILDGTIPLRVDGYSSGQPDGADNRRVAKIRANRVKSELIVRRGLTEECFITRTHAGGGDYVTVRVVVPAPAAATTPAATAPAPAPAAAAEAEAAEPSEAPRAQEVSEPSGLSEPSAAPSASIQGAGMSYSPLSLHANLLRYATLTPHLGVEWRFTPRWSLVAGGAWTSWSWDGQGRRYALWEVAPEVRHYIGNKCRGYVGILLKAGQFNYKLSATGRQGDLLGGGIAGGCRLRLTGALALDLHLALGCLHADYERYTLAEGVRTWQSNANKNWWGPVDAGVTLVWDLF